MVGRQQLLRHDGAPDGAESDQRPAVGRRTVRDRLRATRCRRPRVHRRQGQGGELPVLRRRHPCGRRRAGGRCPRRSARAGSRCDPVRAEARRVRGQPHRAGPRRRELRPVRPHQDRHRQGQARRSTDRRAGDRRARQHRQFRCAASALPRDEHTGPAAFRRAAVRVLLVRARLAESPVRTRWTRFSTASPPRYSPVSLRATKTMSAHWFSM